MYTIHRRVGYSQLMPDWRLSLTALLDLFQDCGTFHGEDAGLGLAAMDARGQRWLLSRWRIKFLSPLPGLGEPISVGTQAYSCRMSMLNRRYWLRGTGGALVAEGDALWVLCDKASQKPIPAASGCDIYLEPADFPPLEGLPRRLPAVENGRELPSFSVTAEMLDTNRHCNNVRAIGLCARYLPADFTFSGFAADYHRQLPAGASVTPLLWETGGCVTVSLFVNGSVCVTAAFLR
ncbi:MAG: hypothetical protein IK141_02840 [Clostridia bacterium]|nr:hypothetical protein [Clostridia bacterium]